MKSLLLVITIFSFCTLSAQSLYHTDKYNGTLSELYLYRQPSAKAEAMGRGMVANTDADFGSYYNPALTSLGSGINLSTSFSNPYYLAEKSKFNYFGASYSDKKLGSFGFSRYYWTLGEDIPVTNEFGQELGEAGEVNFSLYALNYSREIVKDFSAGVNLGIAHMHFPGEGTATSSTGDAFTLDFGLLKKFDISSPLNKNFQQSINIGSSVYNLTGTKISVIDSTQKDALPVIFRLGASYTVKMKGSGLIPGGNLFESLTHVEYQNVTNEDYDKAFKIGEEFTISEIFAIRLGYYTQTVNDYNAPDYNVSSQSQFTYGGGVKIPLHLIFDMKKSLNLNIDYVNMEPPTFAKGYTTWDNFQTISFNLKFVP